MRTGRRIAFDVGKARIGVAVSDPHGILASPRNFVSRAETLPETLSSLLSVIADEDPIEVYVGLPVNLRNQHTESTEDALLVAGGLTEKIGIDVRLIDERLTTKLAAGAMSSAGKSTRAQRESVDSASAAVILETAMNFEKANGKAPGINIKEYANG